MKQIIAIAGVFLISASSLSFAQDKPLSEEQIRAKLEVLHEQERETFKSPDAEVNPLMREGFCKSNPRHKRCKDWGLGEYPPIV